MTSPLSLPGVVSPEEAVRDKKRTLFSTWLGDPGQVLFFLRVNALVQESPPDNRRAFLHVC